MEDFTPKTRKEKLIVNYIDEDTTYEVEPKTREEKIIAASASGKTDLEPKTRKEKLLMRVFGVSTEEPKEPAV